VSVTFVPLEKFALQVPGQLIPVGLLVTVPDPDDGDVTVNSYEVAECKVAEVGAPAQPVSKSADNAHQNISRSLQPGGFMAPDFS
jgi:hypothetical protein